MGQKGDWFSGKGKGKGKGKGIIENKGGTKAENLLGPREEKGTGRNPKNANAADAKIILHATAGTRKRRATIASR